MTALLLHDGGTASTVTLARVHFRRTADAAWEPLESGALYPLATAQTAVRTLLSVLPGAEAEAQFIRVSLPTATLLHPAALATARIRFPASFPEAP